MMKRIRPIRIDYDVAYITVPYDGETYEVMIDAEDVELVDGVNWTGNKVGHQVYAQHTSTETRRTILLHRYLVGAAKGDRVTFIDGNSLNCRKSNLDAASRVERRARRAIRAALPNGIKFRDDQFYVPTRMTDGAFTVLGPFDTLDEAIAAKEQNAAERQAVRNPGYVLGAKPDPAKLAETQERLAKRRAAVQATG